MKVFIYGLSSSAEPSNIRYIGKTKNLKTRLRCHLKNDYHKCKSYKNNWINKEINNGNTILIVLIEEVHVDLWQEKERYYIDKYKKEGYKLTNTDIGGFGGPHKGRRKHTEEAKRKMSESRKGIVFTDEHKKNLSISHKGIDCSHINKAVYKIERYTGTIIEEYESIKKAADSVNISDSAIILVCKNRRKSAGGYYWCYVNEHDSFIFIPFKRQRDRKIAQIDVSTNSVLVTYDSIKEAAKISGIDRSTIGHEAAREISNNRRKNIFWRYV